MEKQHWLIRWQDFLLPDLAMVPTEHVFGTTTQQRSLTATVTGTPGLLFAAPDVLALLADQVLAQPAALISSSNAIDAMMLLDTHRTTLEIFTTKYNFSMFLSVEDLLNYSEEDNLIV